MFTPYPRKEMEEKVSNWEILRNSGRRGRNKDQREGKKGEARKEMDSWWTKRRHRREQERRST